MVASSGYESCDFKEVSGVGESVVFGHPKKTVSNSTLFSAYSTLHTSLLVINNPPCIFSADFVVHVFLKHRSRLDARTPGFFKPESETLPTMFSLPLYQCL